MSTRTPAIAKPATPAPAQTQEQLAAALTAQWGRAQAGLIEILRFGALLLDVQQRLIAADAPRAFSTGERPGNKENNLLPGGWNKGTGLKAWLATHCPEINYKTAYGYMVAASGLRREARLAEDVPLLPLMGVDPVSEERAERLRARVLNTIEGATLSLLKAAGTSTPPIATAPGGAREGAGRPAKVVLPPPTPQEAADEAYPMIAKLYEWAVTRDGWGLLNDGDLVTMMATLNDVIKRGKVIQDARRR